MLNFCTLFDSYYLSRGLALYRSLEKNCSEFHLYIFAFDDKAVRILKKLALQKATIITLKEFEDQKLLEVKPKRTVGEYCWTCTSSTILYVLKNFSVSSCTYLDADIYFFADPKILIDEMGDKSVLITEHRYSKEHDQTETAGKYCVQFVTFKNDENGLKALNWWRDACIDWCYARVENGKFGDQKYLDDWVIRFEGVHELKNLGGGVAPWNVDQYNFYQKSDNVIGQKKDNNQEFELIFYHFHSLKFLNDKIWQLSAANYNLSNDVKSLIYKAYLKEIISINWDIKNLSEFSDFTFDDGKRIGFLKRVKLYCSAKGKNLINIKDF